MKNYHQEGLEKATTFCHYFQDSSRKVKHNVSYRKKYDINLHVLQRMIEAVVLCYQQGLPLRRHCDKAC